jgi:multimeric flavodoxin WrbA
MESADLIVFTTPNYCMGPTASMKALLDLMFDCWMSHRPKEWMFNKRAVVISTTAGAGAAQAIKCVKKSLFYWGIPYIRSYGVSVQAMNWNSVKDEKKAKIERDMTNLAAKLTCIGKPKVGMKEKFIFRLMANMHKAGWDSSPAEKQYWEQRGWLSKDRPWKS